MPASVDRKTKLLAAGALLVAVIFLALLTWVARRGFSARAEPHFTEEWVARNLRSLATPADAKQRTNPLQPSPELMREARAHYGDHCAVCHAADGNGKTLFGAAMYPPTPDLRESATQELTDGELYYIIENGIRFTGMPAFGEEGVQDNRDSWMLVHLIRRLPKLTPEELKEIEANMPKSPHELQEQKEIEDFLSGE